MQRGYKIALVVTLIGGVIAALILLTMDRRPASDVRPNPAAVGWPADRLFGWSFDVHPDPTEMYLSLEIRSMTKTLGELEGLSISPQSSAMPADQATARMRTGSAGLTPGWKGEGSAIVQLIDLRDLDAVPANPDEHLRLLATIRVGGMASHLNEPLPPGRVMGFSNHALGTWNNNELYLMSFYVQNDRELTHYDVVVMKAPEMARR